MEQNCKIIIALSTSSKGLIFSLVFQELEHPQYCFPVLALSNAVHRG